MMPLAFTEPLSLEGHAVRLEPLSLEHLPRLAEIGLADAPMRWFPFPPRTRDDLRAWIETALHERSAGTALPFATIDRRSGLVVGSTRFGNVDRAHRRAEIGWTWLASAWQRTALNTEAKYLMLRHAFESWRLLRVELKTDALNERSRRAILRLGAVEEGTFRHHLVVEGGRLRDTVWFSVLAEEWPAARARLEALMRR